MFAENGSMCRAGGVGVESEPSRPLVKMFSGYSFPIELSHEIKL